MFVDGSANRTLGYRRNVKTKMPKIRERPYNILVRPIIDFPRHFPDNPLRGTGNPISDSWNMLQLCGTRTPKSGPLKLFKQVQHRTARCAVNNFDTEASLTRILQELGLRILEQRRAMPSFACLTKLFTDLLQSHSQHL